MLINTLRRRKWSQPLLLSVLVSVAVLGNGCSESLKTQEQRILLLALNGVQETEYSGLQSEIRKQGRAKVVFATLHPKNAHAVDRMVADASLTFDAHRTEDDDGCIAAREAFEAYARAVSPPNDAPSWFALPPSSKIARLYNKRCYGYSVRVLESTDGLLWIIGIGERWRSQPTGPEKGDTGKGAGLKGAAEKGTGRDS